MTKRRTWSAELTCVGLNFRWKKDGMKLFAREVPFPVILEREPDNEYDENAIKVMLTGTKFKTLKQRHLGYLPRNLAALLAPRFDDKSIEQVKVWMTHVDPMGGEGKLDARFRDVPKGTAGKKKPVTKRPPGAP